MRKLLVVFIVTIVMIAVGESPVRADPPLPLPRMPICGDQDGSETPLTFQCTEFIPSTDVQVFQVPGTGQVDLRFDFVFREATFNNELGFYKVENAGGTVKGLEPGAPGYLAAALANATIVFPSGSTASSADVTLRSNGGELVAFFIIQGDTLANFLRLNPNNELAKSPLAFFALNRINPDSQLDHFIGYRNANSNYTQFGFEDQTSGGDRDYDDIVYNITPPLDPLTGQINLTPLRTTLAVGGTHFLTARVTDMNGDPVAAASVSFNVTGAHAVGGTATTDVTGKASFSYIGASEGTDTVVASIAYGQQTVISNKVFVDWLVDTDGDALYDSWETKGLDLEGDGILEADLPAMGADPYKKDVFVQVDWMENENYSQKPDPKAIEMIVDAFANSGVDYGKGINLHVDAGPGGKDYATDKYWPQELLLGHAIPYEEVNVYDALFVSNFPHDGRPKQSDRVFHYVFFVSTLMNLNCVSGGTWGQRSFISLGCYGYQGTQQYWNPADFLKQKYGKGSINEQAGTFMHELGHNLGLGHGGNEGINYKPNYLSVMNYSFQFGGLIKADGAGPTDGHFDYSRVELHELKEDALNEHTGLNDARADNYGTKYYVNSPGCLPSALFGPLIKYTISLYANSFTDWNCNAIIDPIIGEGTVKADINGPDDKNQASDTQTLASYDDWGHLTYKVQNIGLLGETPTVVSSATNELTIPEELTFEQDLKIQRISEPRVLISQTVTPTIVSPNATVTYLLTMLNIDASDANQVYITYILPFNFSYQNGSTQGVTSADPVIAGQNLSWGPFTLPANGETLAISFRATTAGFAGGYSGILFGSSTNGLVNPFGDRAQVEVTTPELPQSEHDALVALYNSTNGANWTNKAGWLSMTTPCTWYGVACSSNHVTGLYLAMNQLNGQLPTQLGNLTGLQELLLYQNNIVSSIPESLGNLTQLSVLSLANNQLSGSIPANWGNLVNLQKLHMQDNQLVGSIPSELGYLTKLLELDFSNNQLSGPLPSSLTNLTNLTAFLYGGNHLCEPTDMGFQAWLGSIAVINRGVRCQPASTPAPTATITPIAHNTPTPIATPTASSTPSVAIDQKVFLPLISHELSVCGQFTRFKLGIDTYPGFRVYSSGELWFFDEIGLGSMPAEGSYGIIINPQFMSDVFSPGIKWLKGASAVKAVLNCGP